MAQQKVDYQKINSLKAKVYDRMVDTENCQIQMQNLRKEIDDLNKQIIEEQNKINKK